MRFDIEYISPHGHTGIHAGFVADDENDARIKSAIALTESSQWTPEDITIISVKESTHFIEE